MKCCRTYRINETEIKSGRPKCSTETESRVLKVCSKCLSEIGQGKPHDCTKSKRIDNLKHIVFANNDNTEDRVASQILKEKCKEQNSMSVSLTQNHGKPLRVEVTPTKDKENQMITTCDMKRIKTDLNLSENKAKRLAGHLRVSTKSRKCLQPGFIEALRNDSHALDDYFDVQNMTFKGKEEPTVFCQDMQSLVYDIIQKRGLSMCDLLFKSGNRQR